MSTDFIKDDMTWRDRWCLLFPDEEYIWQKAGSTVRAIKLSDGWYAEQFPLVMCFMGASFEGTLQALSTLMQERLEAYAFGSGKVPKLEELGPDYEQVSFIQEILNGSQPDRAVFTYKGEGNLQLRTGDISVRAVAEGLIIGHTGSGDLISVNEMGDETVEGAPQGKAWLLKGSPEEMETNTIVLNFREIDFDVDYTWPKARGHYLHVALFGPPEPISMEFGEDAGEKAVDGIVEEAERILSEVVIDLDNCIRGTAEMEQVRQVFVRDVIDKNGKPEKVRDVDCQELVNEFGYTDGNFHISWTDEEKSTDLEVWGFTGDPEKASDIKITITAGDEKREGVVKASELYKKDGGKTILKDFPSELVEKVTIKIEKATEK